MMNTKTKVGVLDPIDRLYEMKRFYPQFAKSQLKIEGDFIIEKVWEYLNNDLGELARNHGKFMHLLRLLRQVDDELIPSEERRKLALRLWELYQHPNVEGSKKFRVADTLTSYLSGISVAQVPLIWLKTESRSTHSSEVELREFGKELNWRVLFKEIEERFARDYRDSVGTSCSRRKAHLISVVQLTSACRVFWDSCAVGRELEELFELSSPDVTSASIFYKIRVMSLFCNHEYWHECVMNGKFWKWWEYIGCRSASSWDAIFGRSLFRAVKHGWAKGAPLNVQCRQYVPILFQILTSALAVPMPSAKTVSFAKESVGGELTPLLDKPLNIVRKLAKILALLLEPLSGPILMEPSNQQSACIPTTSATNIWDYIQSLVSLIFPLTHPNNTGKWSRLVSQFVDAFIQAYIRRVARERMSGTVVSDLTGRYCHDGIPTMSYRLGRAEDEKIVNWFLPILMQGIYSKSLDAGSYYESSIKRLCYLLPEETLEPVLQQLVTALEAVAESHQLQTSLRLLTQLIPLILQRVPGMVPQLLTLILPAIDGAEPFKTVQALTFYLVLFSHIGCRDLAAIEVSELPIETAAETIQKLLFPTIGESSPLISFQNYPIETLSHFTPNFSSQHSNNEEMIMTTSTPQEFWTQTALRERVSQLLVATSIFPDWAVEFFDQLLRLISYSTKTDKNAGGLMGTVDRSFAVMTKFCVYFILSGCDEELAVTLCKRFVEWINSNIFPDAAKLMSMLTRTMVQARPSICVPILLPAVLKRLPKIELDDEELGPIRRASSSFVTPGSTQEQSLLWYLECFGSSLRCSANYLRVYESDIASRIQWALTHESKKISRGGAKALRRIIESTCGVTLECSNELEVSDKKELKSKEMNIFRWGQPWWIENLLQLSNVPMDPRDTTVNPPIDTVWKELSEEDLEFVKRFVALGLQHIEELLRYCIPEEWRSIDSSSLKSPYQYQSIAAKFKDASNTERLLLPHGLIIQSQTKLLTRALSVGRKILKAVTPLFPDERNRITPGFPIVSNVDGDLGNKVANFLAETCIAVARCHLGLVVDSNDAMVNTIEPLVQLRGVEDSVVIKKILNAMDQLLVRHWAVSRIHAQSGSNGNIWVWLNQWTSVTHGIHATSLWQDQPRTSWEESLLATWYNRINQRRTGQPFNGHRRTLLLLVTRFGDHYYAENRALAQEILKDAFTCHYGARTKVIGLLTSDLLRETTRLSTFIQIKESPPDLHTENIESISLRLLKSSPAHKSESQPSLTSMVSAKITDDLDYKNQISPPLTPPRLSEQNELELCYARITGVTYCLNHLPMLRRLWGSLDVISQALHAICEAFKAPIARDKLQSRLLCLTHGIVNYREIFNHDKEFEKSIVKGLLQPILSDLMSGKTSNWRFQLVATGILTIFNSKPITALEESYSLWLLAASNPSAFPPLLNTLAIFSLTLYLKVQLENGASSAPPALIEKMQHESSTIAITSALIHAHHENCLPGPVAYPETAYQLVVDILKFDRSWPYSRTSRLSHNLSIHNCVVAQTVLEFQYATCNNKMSDNAFIKPWIKQLEHFMSQPLGEVEHLVAGCELIAGLVRASSAWDNETQQALWTLLSPCLVLTFQKLDQELFADFLDALRYGVDTLPKDKLMRAFIPAINFVLDLNSIPDVNKIKDISLDFDQGLIKSTLDATKRLRLLSAVLLETRWKVPVLAQSFISSVNILIAHPYKQIRQETARVLYTIFCVGSEPLCPDEFHDIIQSFAMTLLVLTEKLIPFIIADGIKSRDLTAQRPSELCETETLLLLVIAMCRSLRADAMSDVILKILPLAFEALKHPEDDIASTAWTALSYVVLGIAGIPIPQEHRRPLPREASHYEFVAELVSQLSRQRTSTSWKVRHSTIRLVELLGTRMRLSLYNTPQFTELITICVNGLTDNQTEVRNQARIALSCLAITLSNQDYEIQTKVFADLAGPPLQVGSRPILEVMGGVLGLTALVHSVPYHVPEWLPEAVTLLARYGSSKAPDTVRRQVQQGLQEFFKTHQDAWQQSHVGKFTESQLDILETHKGRPVYFA